MLYCLFTEPFGCQIKDREMQISELAAALDVANKDTEKVRKELDDVKTGMPEASVPVDWLAAQITHVKDQLADAQEERDKGKQDLDRVRIPSAVFSIPR